MLLGPSALVLLIRPWFLWLAALVPTDSALAPLTGGPGSDDSAMVLLISGRALLFKHWFC